MSEPASATFHGTTILAVRKGNQTCVGGDGQVTMQNMVIKAGARKVWLDRLGTVGA